MATFHPHFGKRYAEDRGVRAPSSDPAIDRTVLRRAVSLGGLAVLECVACALLVADLKILQEDSYPLAMVLLLKGLRVAVAGFPVLLLILSRRIGRVIADLDAQREYAWQLWLMAHVAAFAVLAATLWHAGVAAAASPTWPLTLLGIALAACALVLLLFAAAPPAGWIRFLRNHWPLLLVSAAAGYVLRRFVIETPEIWQTQVWELSSRATLEATHTLLSFVYPKVMLHPPDVLGVGTFAIQVFGPCSGIEGMMLMAVFTFAYLLVFRKALAFPSAFVLLPLGMAVMWITNVLRITTLFIIGASASEEIATRGFHSYAGWIAFGGTAVLVIAIAHRFLLRPVPQSGTASAVAYRPRAAFALLAPLLVMLGSFTVASALSSAFVAWHPIAVLLTVAVLWYYRAEYRLTIEAPSFVSPVVGVAVFIGWLVSTPSGGAAMDQPPPELQQMPLWASGVWIAARVIGSVIVVPIVEELAFRGYLLRKLVAADWERVRPDQFTLISFLGSSLLFGILHDRWVAGTLAGAAFAVAMYRKGRLADAIVAHVIANGLIAVWVLAFGRWSLWA
jgi:exosortase E/protease (VPEID-CTERM system)